MKFDIKGAAIIAYAVLVLVGLITLLLSICFNWPFKSML